MMYILNDAQFADTLRRLGFAVIRTNQTGPGQFAVLRTAALDEILQKHYADKQLICSNVLCM